MRWYTKESFTDILQTLHRLVLTVGAPGALCVGPTTTFTVQYSTLYLVAHDAKRINCSI